MKSKLAFFGGMGVLVLAAAIGWTLGPPPSHQDEDQTPVSVMVQGSDLETASTAVLQVGGEITHELGVIKSVGADLTPSQVTELRDRGDLKIYQNRSVEVSGYIYDEPDTELVIHPFVLTGDTFDSGSYDGGSGDVTWRDWSGDWQETGEGDGSSSGLVQVASSSLCSDGFGLCIGGNNLDIYGHGVYRDIDLTCAFNASLDFSYRKDIVKRKKGDVNVEYSRDGGMSWTTLASYQLDRSDSGQISQSFPINPSRSGDTRIRFVGTEDGVNGHIYFDYVAITYQFVADPEHPDAVGLRLFPGTERPTGLGTTVAVLDTGVWNMKSVVYDTSNNLRLRASYNAIEGTSGDRELFEAVYDEFGHGTHITGIILSSESSLDGTRHGIAPDAGLVVVKAFDDHGQGTYMDVIRGIDYVVSHKDLLGIRVLNCSFSAPAVSLYWDDPLNQAIMAAWDAGIVVVASAGNRGPDPMTIGVPGNVPYVITVGAMSDGFTPDDGTEDYLASFSSTGPTAEGFVKPEVVAPGGHILAFMPPASVIAQQHPEFHDSYHYFRMSGTSQSAAIVSGIVALMLEEDPTLTPDDVKSRLIDSARPAVDGDAAAYSVFQQGAGMVNAYDAVNSTAVGIANNGLDVAKELADTEHYGGPANQYADGTFYIMESTEEVCAWDGSYNWIDAYLWSDGQSLAYLWSDALGQAYLWSDGQGLAYLWSDALKYAYLWSDAQGLAYLWSDTLIEPVSINTWVPEE